MDIAPQHHRRSIRFAGYDYTQHGAYFITICAHRKKNVFGRIENGAMIPNRFGRMVAECWEKLPEIFPNIILDEFIVMPNHVHGIVCIENFSFDNGTASPAQFGKPVAGSLSTIVGTYKSMATRHINKMRSAPPCHVWQRNFYEHIIRNEEDLNAIRQYIAENPLNWEKDSENSKS